MEPITPQAGSSGDPRHFVGRARTTRIATISLLEGTNLALTDPRRMGKTSWMKHFCATTTDFDAVIIDYEGVRNTEEFLIRTAERLGRHQSVPSRARQSLRGFFENLEEVGAGPVKIKVGVDSLSATRLLSDTVRAVDTHAIDRPLLVCMDEVPIGLRNIAEGESPLAAREVLQTLRALRLDTQNVRWIVCGSIGFHHVLRQCGATEGDINDLVNLPLGPLDAPEDAELSHRLLLGTGRRFDHSAEVELAATSGKIPFLMHKVADLLREGEPEVIDARQVETAFDNFIDDRDGSRAVTHLLTRLDPNYGHDASLARGVLDELATSARPVDLSQLGAVTTHEERANQVIDLLIDDHYLVESGGRLSWRYDVLRLIWSRRRRLGRPV